MNYDEVFIRLFKTTNIKEIIESFRYDYIDAIFDNKNASFESIIDFIKKYEQEIIKSVLNDEDIIFYLIQNYNVIDTTKKHLITEEYIVKLLEKIKNGFFDINSTKLYVYILKIINLFLNKLTDEEIKDALDLNILSIVENTELSNPGEERILSLEEKQESAKILLSWNKKCDKTILPYIFLFERLKENIITLMNSHQVNNNMEYMNKLISLLKTCELSINVRDLDTIPNKEQLEKINNMFKDYDSINKSIVLDTLNEGDIMLVHFIRDNDVCYQLVDDRIIDISNKENNSFDTEKSDFFVSEYFQSFVSFIEKNTRRKFNINDPEMRLLLMKAINHFNFIMNYRPLDRLPIKKNEVSTGLRTYIRATDYRLSCSFTKASNLTSHLNRKIGLILRPKTKDDILSISQGYTSEKNFYDYENDCFPCTTLFDNLNMANNVNETCVNAKECEVIGVLLLSNEEEMVKKANIIANEYNTTVINLANNWSL